MVILSVSKVARILAISRKEVQQQINNGKLQTHEGYVTTDSVRLAYPEFNICSEQDVYIKKIKKIKNYAERKIVEHRALCTKNEKKLLAVIDKLKLEIQQLKRNNTTK